MNSDEKWMRRAITLAKRGQGKTSPNPCVGAVLVRAGKRIGEGWHRGAGKPHAEVEAIMDAKRRGARIQGATLYVTLEPCSTFGRTPPCTEAVTTFGIRRVVVGAIDPNPKHRGRGLKILKRNRVKVVKGIMAEECTDLNRAWNHWIVSNTPWVIAKCGMTLDGKIATKTGESCWITSEEARKEAHRLRSQVDAVLVGVNTVLRDNPQLSVRYGIIGNQPLRVILDHSARTPLSSKLLKSGSGGVLIFVGKKASVGRIHKLEKKGAQVIRVSTSDGTVSLREVLRVLGRMGVVQLMVEGGGMVLGAFVRQKLAHEVRFFVAPKILGGKDAIKAVGGEGFTRWRNALDLKNVNLSKFGSNLMIFGLISR
jgi:diaminohydroxyphosphoribosylaminopyrimidine deaminase / 5-amino-6-(5-phosphoribosylamino)uracil reductase